MKGSGLFYGFVLLAAVFAVGVLEGCSREGFVSGRFILDTASRLPTWFTPTQSIPRQDVEVHITMYEPTTSLSGKVEVEVAYSNRVLDKATGTWRWHPKSLKSDRPANPPTWTIIEIRGTEEIYEQAGRNDVLTIVDRP